MIGSKMKVNIIVFLLIYFGYLKNLYFFFLRIYDFLINMVNLFFFLNLRRYK